jgi:hypothetical protein
LLVVEQVAVLVVVQTQVTEAFPIQEHLLVQVKGLLVILVVVAQMPLVLVVQVLLVFQVVVEVLAHQLLAQQQVAQVVVG